MDNYIGCRSLSSVVLLRDEQILGEQEEYCKKLYKRKTLYKLQELTEYYKYHSEIPRTYMIP